MADQISNILIDILINAVGSLTGNVATDILQNDLGKRKQSCGQKSQDLYRAYINLTDAIDAYPCIAPKDILQGLEGAPNYALELFDETIRILEYQIADYKARLSTDRNAEMEAQIRNRQWAIQEMIRTRDRYNIAKKKYEAYLKKYRKIIELEAGQDVQNRLCEVEVAIQNVFVAGSPAGDPRDPDQNIILATRRNLIDSMRADLGTDR